MPFRDRHGSEQPEASVLLEPSNTHERPRVSGHGISSGELVIEPGDR